MYIIDTHTLLFFLSDSKELPETLKNLIAEEKNIAVSIISLWEIAIKQSLGKLKIDYSLTELENFCFSSDISILPVLPGELDIIKTLPDIHGDPFDRLIISQAIYNAAILITRDKKIPKYPVRTLWD